jgi:hypothetical protein
LRIPFPNITADVQIVTVVDTSASMCNEIKTLVTDVPGVLERLRDKGKKAEMTMFLLGAPECCIKDESGNTVPFDIYKYAKNTEYFHIASMPQEYKGTVCKNACGADGSSDEDWGDGINCALLMGPYKGPGEFGWRENVVKVAIPISDELPGGIECGCPSGTARKNFDAGLKKAIEDGVYVFAFRGESCGYITPLRDGQCSNEDIGSERPEYCRCARGPLLDWMTDISNQTGGKMYNLTDVVASSDSIEKIISSIQPNRVPYLEAGTVIPKNKDINSVTNILPVPIMGKYVEIYVYHWNSN